VAGGVDACVGDSGGPLALALGVFLVWNMLATARWLIGPDVAPAWRWHRSRLPAADRAMPSSAAFDWSRGSRFRIA
jgi:hypothetical protein